MGHNFEKSEFSRELREDIVYNSDQITKPADVEIHGRTLVNLLGRAGNAIYSQYETDAQGNVSISGDKFVLSNSGQSLIYSRFFVKKSITLVSGKYYVFVANASHTQDGCLILDDFYASALFKSGNGVKTLVFQSNGLEKYIAYNALIGEADASEQISYMRLYEISSDEYTTINSLSADEIAKRYPYVDDIRPIVNPYIECKDNLIHDMCIRGGTTVYGNVTSDSTSPFLIFQSKIGPGEYTFNIEGFDGSKHYIFTQLPDGTNFNATEYDVTTQATFTKNTSSEFPALIIIGSRNDDLTNTENLYSNILSGNMRVTLVEGKIPKTYDECHNSRIMFETKLYEGETISRRNDGTYVKNSEWGEVSLDKVFPKKILNSGSGYKITEAIEVFPEDAIGGKSYLIRHDGVTVDYVESAVSTFEHWYVHNRTSRKAVFILPNYLTGWGDGYTPTEDEIKAFFLGWKMYRSGTGGTSEYYGEGYKAWCKLYCGIGTPTALGDAQVVLGSNIYSVNGDFPYYKNDYGHIPYKIIYKKATPVIEELNVQGSLSIKNGVDVKAGSGLVTGERINAYYYTAENGSYFVNCGMQYAKYRIKNFLRIAENDKELSFNQRSILLIATEQTICHGDGQAYIKQRPNGPLSIDYLVYEPDTVTNYEYSIYETENTKGTIGKVVEDTSDYNDELAKTKQELTKVKEELRQRSNPNLLINSNFRQVINQREATSYITSGKYTIDRWQYLTALQAETNNITVNDGYITLNAGSANNVYLIQRFDTDVKSTINKSEWLTVSLRYRSTMTFKVELGGYAIILPASLSWTTTHFTVKSKPSKTNSILIQNYDGTNFVTGAVDIEWVKLEVGEYATPFIPRPYAEELHLCKKYFIPMLWHTDRGWTQGYGFCNSATGGLILIPNEVKMRTIPTLYGGASSIANWAVYGNGTSITVADSTTVRANAENGVLLQFQFQSSGLTKGTNVMAQYNSGTLGGLDAEIY